MEVLPVSLPHSYLGPQPDLHSDPRNHLPFGGQSAAQDDSLQKLWVEKKERERTENHESTAPLAYLRKAAELRAKQESRAKPILLKSPSFFSLVDMHFLCHEVGNPSDTLTPGELDVKTQQQGKDMAY